jgi:hypothetical protein
MSERADMQGSCALDVKVPETNVSHMTAFSVAMVCTVGAAAAWVAVCDITLFVLSPRPASKLADASRISKLIVGGNLVDAHGYLSRSLGSPHVATTRHSATHRLTMFTLSCLGLDEPVFPLSAVVLPDSLSLASHR